MNQIRTRANVSEDYVRRLEEQVHDLRDEAGDLRAHFDACEKQRLEQLEKMWKYIEFFRHRFHEATIGGCPDCPFPEADPIHEGRVE